MAKYLYRVSYSQAGVQGVLKEGGTSRAAAVQAAVASVGGTVEAQYWAFGGDDYIGIFDLPSNAAAAALSLTVGASGITSGITTTVLLTAADVDAAVQMHPSYRPPGA